MAVMTELISGKHWSLRLMGRLSDINLNHALCLHFAPDFIPLIIKVRSAYMISFSWVRDDKVAGPLTVVASGRII